MRFLDIWTATISMALSLSQAQSTYTTSDQSLTRALSAFRTLQKFYSPSTGLYVSNPSDPSTSYPSCWWQSASTLTTLSNLLLLFPSLEPQISPLLQNTYSLAANSSGASNDDIAWWGLAWIAAYDATGEEEYLQTAEGIFEYLKGVWGTRCGGGGMWRSEKKSYVNAITNELVICLAASLANRSAQGKAEGYGDWAEMAWTWFANSGMINPQGLTNDGLNTNCENNGQTPFTYTQGVELEALVELYRYTNREYYLDTAYELANASMQALTDERGVVVEGCEKSGSCDADQGIFKGVYVRGLMVLGSMGGGMEGVREVIGGSAWSLWERGRGGDDGGLIGVRWTGPFEADRAGFASQSSGLDCLVADMWVGGLGSESGRYEMSSRSEPMCRSRLLRNLGDLHLLSVVESC